MDAELFNEALATALDDAEISAALATLAGDGDLQAVRADLENAVRAQVETIESGARGELARLEAAQTHLDAALDAAAAEEAGSTGELTTLMELTGLSTLAAAGPGAVLPVRRPWWRWFLTRRIEPDPTPRVLEQRLKAAREPSDWLEVSADINSEIGHLNEILRERVLARSDEWPDVAKARAQLNDARASALRSVLERGVRPVCRDWVNDQLRGWREQRLSLTLDSPGAPGLAELPNPDHEVPTPDGDELERLLGQLPGGSIGLSGPRGSGKTTLLRSFHQGRRRIGGRAPGLSAMVSAPVEYAPRDFVLHLFERLCLAAGAGTDPDPLAPTSDDSVRSRVRRLSVVTLAVAGAGLAAVAIGGVLLFEAVDARDLATTDQLTLLSAALLAGCALLLPLRYGRWPALRQALAVGAVSVAAVIVFVDAPPAWPDRLWTLLACVWLGCHLAVAGYRTRLLIIGPFAGAFASVVVVEGTVIALAGALGVDIGDRAPTGAVVLLAATVAMLAGRAVDPLFTAEREGIRWPGHLLASALFAAAAIGQVVGLALLALDVRASARLLLGLALLGGGLWWIWLAQRARARGMEFEPTVAASRPFTTNDRTADDARQTAPVIESLEELLDAALASDDGARQVGSAGESLELACSMLRTWRISGRSLDHTELSGVLASAEFSLPEKSALHPPLRVAGAELRRRQERRESWRMTGESWLRRIHYQQSFSSTWSGKVGVAKPLALELSHAGGLSSSEVPMTLPQIVRALQEYLEVASEIEPVVIVIDELDKMASVDAAERFLNEVKAIFGVANCYFLISVSEDAVASFERRGLPFRDVVDSSFDEVRRVGYLSLADAESLLGKRVVLLPMPFAALCHALSGGLARDLVRTTRALFDLKGTLGDARMSVLCRELVRLELRAKRDGTVTAIHGLGGALDVSQPLRWLGAMPIDEPSIAALKENAAPHLPGPADVDDDAQRSAALALRRFVREFVGFWYFCATVVDVFGRRLSFDVLQEPGVGPGGKRDLEAFARARQSFAVEPQLAWDRITTIRDAWSLDVVAPVSLVAEGVGERH